VRLRITLRGSGFELHGHIDPTRYDLRDLVHAMETFDSDIVIIASVDDEQEAASEG
jgi:hypothetical protein